MSFARWFCAVSMTSCLMALPAHAQSAKAALKDAQGKDVGQVQLTQTPHGVLLKMTLKGAPPGERAFHIHAVGKCEAPFESAGPHFNPDNHKHGMMAGQGHAGDLPNLHVPQSGELSIEILAPAVTLVKGKPNSLFDADGSTLIIHAKADDYKTDPSGDAGGRIACGVIQPSGATVGSSPPKEK